MESSDIPGSVVNQQAATQAGDCQLLERLRATPEIFDAIRTCTEAEVRNQRKLRELFGDDDLVRAALTLHDVRRKAARLLPDAGQLWLTQIGLEQSTSWVVARHKAQRFPEAVPIRDLCCGIGIDTAALAQRGPVTAVDCDPAMGLRCRWNCEVWKPAFPVATLTCDVTHQNWSQNLIHADPDRRAGTSRPVKRLEQYQPNLEWMQSLTRSGASGAIKIGPASNFIQKFPDCEIELVSLNGECREATVWFGDLAGSFPFRATVLRSDDPTAVESISVDPLGVMSATADEPEAFLFDPDPAVVRSGMLDAVAASLSIRRLDPAEEYMTGAMPIQSGFVSSFVVEAVLPNSLKELRHWLKRDPSQYYEVKCRRIPVVAADIQRQLPTGDAAPRTVVFVRVNGKARIVVARRFLCSL